MNALALALSTRPSARAISLFRDAAYAVYGYLGTGIVALSVITAAVLFRPELTESERLAADAAAANPVLTAVLWAAVTCLMLLAVGTVVRTRRGLSIYRLMMGLSTAVSASAALWVLGDQWYLRVPLAAFIGTLWLWKDSLWVRNLVAVVIAYAIIISWRGTDLRVAVLVGLAIIVYDVTFVWFSRTIVTLAERMREQHVPLFLELPRAGLLGLGDIILPGVMIVAATQYGAGAAALIGYGLGFAGCALALRRTPGGVPAMLFLVPGVLAGIATSASARAALLG